MGKTTYSCHFMQSVACNFVMKKDSIEVLQQQWQWCGVQTTEVQSQP